MQEVSRGARIEAGGPDGFDADLYLASNPDLRAAFDRGLIGSALEHWREAGEAETRAGARPTLLDHPPVSAPAPGGVDATGLDRDLYLALNPDLAHSLGAGTAQAGDAGEVDAVVRHWLAYGAVEGRFGFGAPVPWDRALGRALAGAAPRQDGCDLFVEADPQAGEEAAIGRRILAALRAGACPVSLRAYTSRDGRLVMEAGREGSTPTHGVTLIVATPSLCRQILATIGPDRLAGRTVLGCFAHAPLRRHMPDGLLLSTLDAVLVPTGGEAGLLRAVSPVPVHEVAIVPARLVARAAARRALGLWNTDRVIVEEDVHADTLQADLHASVAAGDRAGDPRPNRLHALDDIPDPWTGASRLLAAADRFVPAARGRATRHADATAADLSDAPPSPSPTLAEMGCGLVALFASARGAARGAACLPVPSLPAHAMSTAANAPVLSLLVEAEHLMPWLVARLEGQGWGFFELCVVVPQAVARAREPTATAGWDPRIRLVAADPDDLGLAAALRVATGTHLLPVHDTSELARIADGLGAIAARLAEADRPQLLVEAAHAAELGDGANGTVTGDCGRLSLQDRIQSGLTPPVAVSRTAFERIDGAVFLGRPADRFYGLTLALARGGVSIGAVELPGRSEAPAAEAAIAGERSLRHHIVALGGPGAVEPGFLPATFRIRRFAARSAPIALLAVGDAEDIWDKVAASDTEHVLLVARPIRPPGRGVLAALAEGLADPGVGVVCPVVLAFDMTIVEAGLIATPGEGPMRAEEAGWPLDASGPGARALRIRNVHAASLCLATRRSLIREFAAEPAAEAGDAGPLATLARRIGRAGFRILATPFATVRLLRDGADCSPTDGRAEEAGDGWPSGLRQRS